MNNRLRETAESSESGLSDVESKSLSAYASGQKKDTLLSVATVIGGVTALIGYMVHIGAFSASTPESQEHEEHEEGHGEMPGLMDANQFLGLGGMDATA